MKRAILAALLCALLLSGCGGASSTRQLNGQTITVFTEKDGLVAQGVEADPVTRSAPVKDAETYILNRSSVKFHRPTCAWAAKISEENRIEWTGDRETLIEVGYVPCRFCDP